MKKEELVELLVESYYAGFKNAVDLLTDVLNTSLSKEACIKQFFERFEKNEKSKGE